MRLLSLPRAACRVSAFAAAARARVRSPRVVIATIGAVALTTTGLAAAPALSLTAKSFQSSLSGATGLGTNAAVPAEDAEGEEDADSREGTETEEDNANVTEDLDVEDEPVVHGVGGTVDAAELTPTSRDEEEDDAQLP